MKILTILWASLLLSTATVFAQSPVKWKFSSKKINEGIYEIYLHADVDNPWHIYSQSSPDDVTLPTKISFKKNPIVTFMETPQEVGNLVKKYEEVLDITIAYYENKVTFVQKVKVKGKAKTTLSGTVTFMACDDHQCLPADAVDFTITLD
jgi:DsbC/DsbD-like thiol-disulfide interchange protein